jgi:hypothetical protein
VIISGGQQKSFKKVTQHYCLAFTDVSQDGKSWAKEYVQLCLTDEQEIKNFLYTKAYPVCCTVSNVFLLMTFLAYVISPDLRAPLFGKITMIFTFCLFLAYLSISVVSFGHSHLVNQRPENLDYSPVCRVLGFVVQFTYLQVIMCSQRSRAW